MTQVKVAPSDDLRLILCPVSDRRAPFDVAATFKRNQIASPCVSLRSTLFAPPFSYPEPRLAATRPADRNSPPPANRHCARPRSAQCSGGDHRIAKGVDQMKHDHFWTMCASAGATATILAGAATAALAQQSPMTTIVGERAIEEGRSVNVSYRDLNLAAADDERILLRRVKGAARFVCQPDDDAFAYRPFTECVTFARDGARPQVDLAVRRAREIASLGTSSIPLVAIAVVGVR
jgi:UrcA family protein